MILEVNNHLRRIRNKRFQNRVQEYLVEFINKTKEKVAASISALFSISSDTTPDKVIEQMKQSDFEFVTTSLSQEEQDQLRAAFSEE